MFVIDCDLLFVLLLEVVVFVSIASVCVFVFLDETEREDEDDDEVVPLGADSTTNSLDVVSFLAVDNGALT